MTLLELAVQGVEGLSASGRWAFKPGFNVVIGSPAQGEVLGRLLSSLLFPEIAPSLDRSGGRVGLTLLADDGATFRLVGSIGAGIGISRLDVASSKFIALPPGGGRPQGQERWGLPERRLFEALFVFTSHPRITESSPPPTLPMAVNPPAPSGRIAGPGIESRLGALLGPESAKVRGLEELRQRLREVEAEEVIALEAERLQFELDGMQQGLFRSEDALRELDRLRSVAKEAADAVARSPAVSDEALARLRDLPQLVQRRDDLVRRAEEERLVLEGQGESGPFLAALGQDRWFVGSVGLGVGGLAVAILGTGSVPSLRWLALLEIPGFGVAVLLACRHLAALRGREGIARKLALLADRKGRAVRAFEADSREALALTRSLGVEGASELEGRLVLRAELVHAKEDAEAAVATALREEGVRASLALREELLQQISEQERRLVGLGYSRGFGELRRELSELREAISTLRGPLPERAIAPVASEPSDDPATLFQCASALFDLAPARLCESLRERLCQYVNALTDGRFGPPSLTPRGAVAFDRPGAPPLPFYEVPPADRLACLWACRLALIERYLGAHRLFLVIDERFVGLDDRRKELLLRMLRPLAERSQLLWLGPGASAFADSTVHLG